MLTSQQAKYLKDAFRNGRVVCFTGAGISVESGIPAFRGTGGLWERYDPEVYAYPRGLAGLIQRDPDALIGFLSELYSTLLQAQPNLAHTALGVLERQGLLEGVITQNVDNLHTVAGNRGVIELHGNAFRYRCNRCGAGFMLERDRAREMVSLLGRAKGSRRELLRVLSRYLVRCERSGCGGRMRTGVVLFGEDLPEDAVASAYALLDKADTVLVVGSSMEVYPAAGMPLYAKDRGAALIEVNMEHTPLTEICDLHIPALASAALPEVLRIVTHE